MFYRQNKFLVESIHVKQIFMTNSHLLFIHLLRMKYFVDEEKSFFQI